MTESSRNSGLRAISIEPVDDDDFSRNVMKILTPGHKRRFLEFLNAERNFLISPQSYSTLNDDLVSDLNTFSVSRHRSKKDSAGWIRIIRAWVDLVKSPKYFSRSKEDAKLGQIIKETLHTNNASNNQLEMLANRCRVCLTSNSLEMIHLFNGQNTGNEEVSFLDKLNYCSCFTSIISSADNLPQFICKSCSILVENAYQLKLLCAKVEEKYEEIFGKEVNFESVELYEIDANQPEYENNVDIKDGSIISENEETINGEQKTNIIKIDENVPIAEEKFKVEDDYNVLDSELVQPQTEIINEKTSASTSKCINKSENQPFQCSHCGKNFPLKHRLAEHERVHTDERPYMCEVCGKTFRLLSVANMHRVVHSDQKNNKCSYCPFTTKTKWNLRIHERIHTGVQPYECRVCHQKFTTASNIAKHMRNIHENQRTNKCDKCERSFFTRESLRKHSIVHLGLKPFYCPQDGCSSAYGWYNGLKKHIRKMHSNETVKLPKETFFMSKIKHMLN